METNLLNEIKQRVVLLTPNDQLALADFLTENAKRAISEKPSENGNTDKFRRREQEWIEKNRIEYAGQWVALDGDILLAHGADGKKVHTEAQAKGVKTPLMHRVSIKETQPFGGW